MTPRATDFDDWLAETVAKVGPFTLLIQLLRIHGSGVDLLRSAHLHVMDGDFDWQEMKGILDRSGAAWDGVVFWRAGREGLVEEPEAKRRLASLTRALRGDRSLIREGEFFNRDGLRLSLEEG